MQTIITVLFPFLRVLWDFISRNLGALRKEQHNGNTREQVAQAYEEGAMQPDTSQSWNVQVLSRLVEEPEICWPVSRLPIVITSKYGWRELQKGDKKTFHNGIDFKTWDSKPIKACETALVYEIVLPDYKYPYVFKYDPTTKRWTRNDIPKGRAWTPRIVLIGKHSNNQYVYKHCDAIKGLKEGQIINVGEVIGTAGNYGYSMGEHLHFEFYDFLENKGTWAPASDPLVFFEKNARLNKESGIPVIVAPTIFHGDQV